ncbi:MAG: hypothetical protein N838_22070 [Thiohalocapsa sp. PB-PSB1]|nr:MAG: hypothetical protein N838_22070 [Thiohalocapsa sp. PB-PSB1]
MGLMNSKNALLVLLSHMEIHLFIQRWDFRHFQKM